MGLSIWLAHKIPPTINASSMAAAEVIVEDADRISINQPLAY